MSVEWSDPQSREGKKSQKVSDSHRNDVSPLTQGLRYRAACENTVIINCRIYFRLYYTTYLITILERHGHIVSILRHLRYQ